MEFPLFGYHEQVTDDTDAVNGPGKTGAGAVSNRISAVVACYRDAEAVPIMYARLTETFLRIGVDYEIIFVNDASPDNAAEVLAELAGPTAEPSAPKVLSPAECASLPGTLSSCSTATYKTRRN